jgi:voltage-gated potassium channel
MAADRYAALCSSGQCLSPDASGPAMDSKPTCQPMSAVIPPPHHTLGTVSNGRPSLRARFVLAVQIALLVLSYFIVPIGEGSLAVRLAFYGLGIGLVVAITVRQTRRHISGADTAVRVDSLVLAIMLGTLLFALSYVTIDETRPEQFAGLTTRLDALYFSVSTAATVGFGDVHASGQLARALVLIQIVFNLVVIATAASVAARAITARRGSVESP